MDICLRWMAAAAALSHKMQVHALDCRAREWQLHQSDCKNAHRHSVSKSYFQRRVCAFANTSSFTRMTHEAHAAAKQSALCALCTQKWLFNARDHLATAYDRVKASGCYCCFHFFGCIRRQSKLGSMCSSSRSDATRSGCNSTFTFGK